MKGGTLEWKTTEPALLNVVLEQSTTEPLQAVPYIFRPTSATEANGEATFDSSNV